MRVPSNTARSCLPSPLKSPAVAFSLPADLQAACQLAGLEAMHADIGIRHALELAAERADRRAEEDQQPGAVFGLLVVVEGVVIEAVAVDVAQRKGIAVRSGQREDQVAVLDHRQIGAGELGVAREQHEGLRGAAAEAIDEGQVIHAVAVDVAQHMGVGVQVAVVPSRRIRCSLPSSASNGSIPPGVSSKKMLALSPSISGAVDQVGLSAGGDEQIVPPVAVPVQAHATVNRVSGLRKVTKKVAALGRMPAFSSRGHSGRPNTTDHGVGGGAGCRQEHQIVDAVAIEIAGGLSRPAQAGAVHHDIGTRGDVLHVLEADRPEQNVGGRGAAYARSRRSHRR